ncbi:MAG: hypothetical protein JWL86_626 [Rhizobium sp.]|nr:hypothetical protein [Rhizobium sp.]
MHSPSRIESFVETAVPALLDLVSIVLFIGMIAVWCAVKAGV